MEDLVDRMLAADDEEALVTVLDEAQRALADPATTEDEVERIRLAGELPTMRLEALREALDITTRLSETLRQIAAAVEPTQDAQEREDCF